MRLEEGIRKPRRYIEEIIGSLERFGQFDFRSDGYIKIERWKTTRALETYKQTLQALKGTVEGESPSSVLVEEATVEWNAEPADIGYKIRQRHIGKIRPRIRPLVDKWDKAGRPYPSSGGFYYTVPNKSYQRVKELSAVPELRDAILNLDLYKEWLKFWETYLPLRYDVSSQMLGMVKSRVDREAFSRHNEEAGTGIQLRGRRLKRKDLTDHASELDFLLQYGFAMGSAFAAVQVAELDPESVWMVTVYDARIKGAIASRSDMEVLGSNWDGTYLTIDGISQTRQAGSDGSGTLSNASTEKRIMRQSVTESVLRSNRHPGVEYPFTSREALLKAWRTDAMPFPGKQYVIGEDMGLVEPVKSPADALFSRGFITVGGKTVPMMLSGSGWTQAVYSVFHNHFIDKAAKGDTILALGDDINLITDHTTELLFSPYIKVKSTNPKENTKKILGMFTVFSKTNDPLGVQNALIGVVPRVIKTISSASKRGSEWGDELSNVGLKGIKSLIPSERVSELVEKDMDILIQYLQWSGERKALEHRLSELWSYTTPEVTEVLLRHNEEWEHRMGDPEKITT